MASGRIGAPTSRGFTLIEILVVIGLIALLIGILVPALAAAKRHAQTVECATRLRQLAIAMEIYADENDGFYPPRNGGDSTMNPFGLAGGPPSDIAVATEGDDGEILLPPLLTARERVWPVAIVSNLRQISVPMSIYQADEIGYLPSYICPGDPDPTPPMTSDERFIPWYSSFIFNGFNDFKHVTAEGWQATDTTAMRRDEIRLPSTMALFGEKKSGPTYAKLYADIYAPNAYHPVTVLDQVRHQGGFSNVGFGDGSTRTFAPPGTVSPENLWAVRDSNRHSRQYLRPRW